MTDPIAENVTMFKWALFQPDGRMDSLYKSAHAANVAWEYSPEPGYFVRPVRMAACIASKRNPPDNDGGFLTYVNIVAEIEKDTL